MARQRRCSDGVGRGDIEGIEHLLSAFGGMGSINDLIIHPANGHALSLRDGEHANAALQDLLSRAYELASEISREATFE